jgi:hypothetical protein
LLSVRKPGQQSGQHSIRKLYAAVRILQAKGNTIKGLWTPAHEDTALSVRVRHQARIATELGKIPIIIPVQMKSTALSTALANQEKERTLPPGVGKYSRELDAALPGKHTRTLYDSLTKTEASILAQLRTGMSRLNGYLHRIGAAESDQCPCGVAKETVKHFLFRCVRWRDHRTDMRQQTTTRWGDLAFFLGGRSTEQKQQGPLDPSPWAPNIAAVKATIRFAMATGRLTPEMDQDSPPTQSTP